MKKRLKIIAAFSFLLIFLTSCQKWLEFDSSRYAFVFVLSLVIGVIGLIYMAINGGDKNK